VTGLDAIRFVVFDFDGVFSDNRVWTNDRGEESVACWRGDALGLRRLEEVAVDHLILSTEVNEVVTTRARKMRAAACIQGAEDKVPILREEVAGRGLTLEATAYVGNDANDVGCLELVGFPVVPADAYPEVVPLAHLVLERRGGYGCVREFCDLVWRAKRAAAA
jgi:3-deoxy-D-manno-octulosonate 8-phosphate phosphatase (KDO 8-P phosphatase)